MNAERYDRGLRMLAAVDGVAGQNVVDTLAQSFPDFARYAVEFPFGDIYARKGLGLRERELATVAALCALGECITAASRACVGCIARRLRTARGGGSCPMQMASTREFPAALNGLSVVREVFAETGIPLPLD